MGRKVEMRQGRREKVCFWEGEEGMLGEVSGGEYVSGGVVDPKGRAEGWFNDVS